MEGLKVKKKVIDELERIQACLEDGSHEDIRKAYAITINLLDQLRGEK